MRDASSRIALISAYFVPGEQGTRSLAEARKRGVEVVMLGDNLEGEARELGAEPEAGLPAMPLAEHVVADYQTTRLSLKAHPLSLLRDGLPGITPAERLARTCDGRRLTTAGLVLVRQRPGSAEGVVFITLEDETGIANLVVMPDAFETFRRPIMTARMMAATGRVQNHEGVVHLRVESLIDLTHRLAELTGDDRPAAGSFSKGRNFH